MNRRARKQKHLPFISLLIFATIVVLWGMNSSLKSTTKAEKIKLLSDIHQSTVETAIDSSLQESTQQTPTITAITTTTTTVTDQNTNTDTSPSPSVVHAVNVVPLVNPVLPAELQHVPPGVKIYKFFDQGFVYHDMNFSCPVPWYWVNNPEEADVIWHNVLDSRFGIAMVNGTFTPRYFPEQKYAYMSLESSVFYPLIFDRKSNGYDFEVDYRIWPDHPHGPADIPAVYLTNPTAPDFTLDFRSQPKLEEKRKDAIMAAFISNCGQVNNRLQILENLTQLMPVHSYGRCVHNYDEPAERVVSNWGDTKFSIAKDYYFLYTPENSEDMSYVTEKVFDGFRANAVPIYMGAPDIDRFIPHPSSIIKVSDFNSTEALANYLKELVADPQKYAKHMEWKKKEFSPEFKRVLRLASRTVQCRLAMKLEGKDFEADLQDLDIFPVN